MPAPTRSPRSVLIALALLVALALGVRLASNDYMLPHQPEPDSVIVWQAAWFDRPAGCEEMVPYAYPAPFYPFLLARLLAVLPGPSYPELQPLSAPLEQHLAAAARRYVGGRTMIAWLAVLGIPALYFLARRFLEPGWALCAAAFLATSLLNQSYAQQARPHTASAALSLIAMVAALRLFEQPSIGRYAVAATCSFVTLGALHNGVFVLPAMVLAHLLAPRRSWLAFLASAAVVALVIPVFYPFYVEAGFEGIFGGDKVDLGGQILAPELFSGRGYLQMLQGFWGYEPVLSVLALVGLALGVARMANRSTRPARETARAVWIVAAFPISFVLVWGIWNVVPARFVNPLIPYLALLGACAAREILTRVVPAAVPARAAWLACGALVLLAVPATACAKLASLRSQSDTHTRAARWLAEHADRARDPIALEVLLYLPLPQDMAGLEEMPPWSFNAWQFYQFDLLRKDTRDELRQQIALRFGAEALAQCLGGQATVRARCTATWLHPWGRLRAQMRTQNEERFRIRPLFDLALFADRVLSKEEAQSLLLAQDPEWIVVSVPTADGQGRMRTREAARELYGEPVARFLPFDVERSALPGSGYELGFDGFARVMGSDAWGPPIEIYRRSHAEAPPR